MSEIEWCDSDDPRVREAFSYALRVGVSYQDGADSEAPSLIFADYDYEVGDGACGLHEDGKRANEPAIVYVRADSHLAQRAEVARLHRQLAVAREALEKIKEYPSSQAAALNMPEGRWQLHRAQDMQGIAFRALREQSKGDDHG